MPPDETDKPVKTVAQVVAELRDYPMEAFEFVERGLSYTVSRIHGDSDDPDLNRHVTGQQLCEGLREFALMQWGRMARTVLSRWGLHSTFDFGRIVFALVDNKLLGKTDRDCIDDFRDVYDFKTAFETSYRIEIGKL